MIIENGQSDIKEITTDKNINYWKEIEKNISDELKDLSGVVLITHNSVEFTDLIDFFQNLRKGQFITILYISLVRSYNYMKKALEFKPLDQKRVIFIDCVSGYAFPVDDNVDEAFYHKPPQNLSEMKDIIRFGVEKINPEVVIVDSLSQFINFSNPTEDELNEFYEFLRTLKKDTINVMQNTFILLYDTKLSMKQHLPKKATDSIIKLEVVR